jgi:protein-L-isoaspartate(D-aspartate) O-methyltransferase
MEMNETNSERKWEEIIQRLVNRGILKTPRVIQALQRVSRTTFLPESVSGYVAADSPLPIGYGQTMSAPLS